MEIWYLYLSLKNKGHLPSTVTQKNKAVRIKSKQGIGNGKGPELFLGKSLLKIKKQIFDTGLLLLPYGVFPVLDSFLPPPLSSTSV